MRLRHLLWLLLISTASAQYVAAGYNPGPLLPFTFVGSSSNNCFNTSGTGCGSYPAVTVTYTPTNGNLLLVDFLCHNSTGGQNPTITIDNGSSTWANAFAYTDGGNYYENEDYTLSVAGGPTTQTAHCGAASSYVAVIVTEYSRTSGSWVFGGKATQAFGSAATATGNNVTPTASAAAMVHGWFLNKSNTNLFGSANSSIRFNLDNNGEGLAVGDQIVASASGSYAASATVTTGGWTVVTSWYK